jgi:HAD superfamily hydrolase (TIGR01459 family)
MHRPAVPPVLAGLRPLASRYDLLLCDVWGVVHDGVAAFPAANEALARTREQGATVILISNAPRPGATIERQIAGYGVERTAYDAVVTSGDVAREEIAKQRGARIFHLGPERDLPNYEGLDVKLVKLEQAELVVCTGLFNDERETPDDYRDLLARMRARDLPMICANPDRTVERGDKLIWCAGALAELYAGLGGPTVFAGKPHAPIYEMALALATRLRGKEIARRRVLAIGDGVHTDLAGATAQGFDCLYVASPIHAADLGLDHKIEARPEELARLFTQVGVAPVGILRRLVW